MDQSVGRVLIVDDEMINIKVLIATLEGFDCIIAKDGERAIELARGSIPPDLILLDVIMPDMSGYEVCTQLKKDALTKDIPIIFITSKDEVEDEAKGLEMGAVDYITKPFSPSIVRARVTNHIQLKKQRDTLLKLNVTDPLTNIPNRRLFDDTLDYECRSASRTQTPLSLIMIDIDHFKQINDSEGHQFGDECLQRVAMELKRAITRSTDLVARYGGEEFVALLPATDQQGAYEIAERMRECVAKICFSAPHENTQISISLGLTSPSPGSTFEPESLIAAADEKLYQAKESGRNRTCF